MRPHMPRLLKGRRPSPAIIVSSLALVVATGGTSYAAVMIHRQGHQEQHGDLPRTSSNNTIKSKDVKNKLAPRQGLQG